MSILSYRLITIGSKSRMLVNAFLILLILSFCTYQYQYSYYKNILHKSDCDCKKELISMNEHSKHFELESAHINDLKKTKSHDAQFSTTSMI